MTVTTATTLVVDELVDEVLRVNFNVTLYQVPCEHLSLDVSDMTGTTRHNITKDILKWRLDSVQRHVEDSAVTAAKTTGDGSHKQHANHDMVFDPDEYEPLDTNMSSPLTADTFNEFLNHHELTLVNFFAPWCIWCRRLEPVYLEAAHRIPELGFHGHARLAQVDCVANQAFCSKNMIRAYPTLRMYKDGDPVNFELFTGSRTIEDLLSFIKQQMDTYQKSHIVVQKEGAARFAVRHGALTAGNDLYRASMTEQQAQVYCGKNEACSGFTWQSKASTSPPPPMPPTKKDSLVKAGPELPMVYFKSGLDTTTAYHHLNDDAAWSSLIKMTNGTQVLSTAGSLLHGPEGCQVAGHLQVRKVPGALRLVIHSEEHDHEAHLINASHLVNEFWLGEPLTRSQLRRLPQEDRVELLATNSHRLDGLPFVSKDAGHSHVHYIKVVTKLLKHYDSPWDTTSYKYTVHSNKFQAPKDKEPTVEFRYDLSPISIVVSQESVPWYKFFTSTCAIVGGVFTVIGILENIIHQTSSAFNKKQI
uniref:Thioredoxin domain-containing protein n=1 Tax=Haptolina ericina TaxID=156174 RepID=A0A7S3ES13_9EUKA